MSLWFPSDLSIQNQSSQSQFGHHLFITIGSSSQQQNLTSLEQLTHWLYWHALWLLFSSHPSETINYFRSLQNTRVIRSSYLITGDALKLKRNPILVNDEVSKMSSSDNSVLLPRASYVNETASTMSSFEIDESNGFQSGAVRSLKPVGFQLQPLELCNERRKQRYNCVF